MPICLKRSIQRLPQAYHSSKRGKRLAELETFDRRWYAGTLGVMNQHLSEFFVTIRSALSKKKTSACICWSRYCGRLTTCRRVVGN